VAHGYNERDIVEKYSTRKINALFSAALRNDAVQNRQQGVAVRMGFNAEGSDFANWVKVP
jgi:hypothetical protein